MLEYLSVEMIRWTRLRHTYEIHGHDDEHGEIQYEQYCEWSNHWNCWAKIFLVTVRCQSLRHSRMNEVNAKQFMSTAKEVKANVREAMMGEEVGVQLNQNDCHSSSVIDALMRISLRNFSLITSS